MTVLRAGLIGAHIGQSRFARAMQIMCAEHGWRLAFEVIDTAERPGFDFNATVADLTAQGWTGVTVTHPWKTHAAAYAGPGMASEVRTLGACNILVFGPPLIGFNTDYLGFLGAWKAGGPATPGRVAMAGAGGVARALGPALKTLAARDIAIWDVDNSRATALAEEIGAPARAVPWSARQSAAEGADGVVNATALGMVGDGRSAFEGIALGPQRWAFDAVYTPTETPFLRASQSAGLHVMTGFSLFQHMAIASFRAYTGLSVDAQTMLPKLAALRPEE